MSVLDNLEHLIKELLLIDDLSELIQKSFEYSASVLQTYAAVYDGSPNESVLSSNVYHTFCNEIAKILFSKFANEKDLFEVLALSSDSVLAENMVGRLGIVTAVFENVSDKNGEYLYRNNLLSKECFSQCIEAIREVPLAQDSNAFFSVSLAAKFMASAGLAAEWDECILFYADEIILCNMFQLVHLTAEIDGYDELHGALLLAIAALHRQYELSSSLGSTTANLVMRQLLRDASVTQKFFSSLLFAINRASELETDSHLALLSLIKSIVADVRLAQQFYANDVAVLVDICLLQLPRQNNIALLQGYLSLLPGIIINCDYKSIPVKSDSSGVLGANIPVEKGKPLSSALPTRKPPPPPPPRRVKSPISVHSPVSILPPTRDEMANCYKAALLRNCLAKLNDDPFVQGHTRTKIFIKRIQFKCNL